MKADAIKALKGLQGISWADQFAEFLQQNGTEIIYDPPGSSEVFELIAELKIRNESVKRANTAGVAGISELIENLQGCEEGTVINNYVFKSESETGVLYIESRSQRIVGAILISEK